jgi:hypothetical protein
MIAGQEQPEMGFLKDWLSNGHDSQGRKLHVPSNHTGFSMLQAKYSTWYDVGGFKAEWLMNVNKLKAFITMVPGVKTSRLSRGSDCRGVQITDSDAACDYAGVEAEDRHTYTFKD